MEKTNNPINIKRNWKSILQSDPTDWLLEPENPSVRYFTLTDLLGKSESDTEVKKTKLNIMEIGLIPKILELQNAEGFWGNEKDFYTDKYKGTVWQLLILAELGADSHNTNIKNACEFILDHSQDRESGGFSIHESAKNGGGRHSEVIPCLTGNILWALISFGFLNDNRVQRAIDWLNEIQRFDDGDPSSVPIGWPYDKYEMCWGKHTCHMGIVKNLKAFAQIPVGKRSKKTQRTIDRSLEFLLLHHIYKKSHDYNSVSKPGWLKFGFPLMYQTDVLEILLVLAQLGIKDERMNDALNIVISKQDKVGKWKLENTFNGKFIFDIEQKGNFSKWITLNALRTLKTYAE
jgi:hypothetical protein